MKDELKDVMKWVAVVAVSAVAAAYHVHARADTSVTVRINPPRYEQQHRKHWRHQPYGQVRPVPNVYDQRPVVVYQQQIERPYGNEYNARRYFRECVVYDSWRREYLPC